MSEEDGPAYYFDGTPLTPTIKTKDPTIRVMAKEIKKKDDFYVKMRVNLSPNHAGVIFGIYGEEPGERTYFELAYDGSGAMDKCKSGNLIINSESYIIDSDN